MGTTSTWSDNVPMTRNGLWNQGGANPSFPAGTQSLRVSLEWICNQGSCTGFVVNYDDVTLDAPPLAVTFMSFTATRSTRGVRLRWRTGSEVDTLAFNVYRQVRGKRMKLNRSPIPARGSVAGAAYSYLDRRPPRAASLRYWLQIVDLDGSRGWQGPIRVGRT